MGKEKIAVIGSYAVGMTISGDHFPVPGRRCRGMILSCVTAARVRIRRWQQPGWERT